MAESDPTPRTVRLMTALLLVGTFAAGTVTGAGLLRWMGPPPPPGPHGPFGPHGPPGMPPAPFPADELGLTPEQRQKAAEIMERHRPELENLIRATFPRVREINEQIEREIAEILTPEQRAKLEQIKATRPPPPPPMPPPPMPPPGR